MDYVLEKNNESSIVKAQKEKDYNILTTAPFIEEDEKDTMLSYLGEPSDNNKSEVEKLLESINKNKNSKINSLLNSLK